MFAHPSSLFRFTLSVFLLAIMCIAHAGDPDTDGDSVTDPFDNCVLITNSTQVDTDSDGWGNACDPDYNNDGTVNFLDFVTLSNAFLTADSNLDLTGDGVVNFFDIFAFRDFFLLTPGPAGYANWINPGDGLWTDAANWFPKALPPAEARVTINQPGDLTVTLPSGSGELVAAEIVLDETLLMTGNTSDRLTVSGRVTVNGTLDLQSGTLNASVVQVENSFVLGSGTLANATLQASTLPLTLSGVSSGTFDNVELHSDIVLADLSQLNIRNGLRLQSANLDLDSTNGFAYLNFEGSQSVDGSGEIRFNGQNFSDSSSRIRPIGIDTVLTIGANITVRSAQSGGRVGETTGSLILQGNIIADVAGRTVEVLGDLLTLDGTIDVSNGATVRIDRNWVASETNSITSNGATLILDGTWQNDGTINATDSTVRFGSVEGDSWSNLGSINLVNSPLDANGTFVVTDFGTFTSDNTVFVVGTLVNTGSTLDINSVGGAEFRIGNGGTILGGSIEGSSALSVGPNISLATLDGVTLLTDLVVLNATQLTLENGLTLNGGNIFMNPTNSFCYLNLNGTQVLGGSGDIRFNSTTTNDSNIRIRNTINASIVTIGAGINISSDTAGGRVGEIGRDLILRASVLSNVSGRTISLRGNVLSVEGTITAVNGGEILIDGNWTNASDNTIDVTDGELSLEGEWINSGNIIATNSIVEFGSVTSDSWLNLGTINLNGSPLTIDGSFLTADLGNLTSDSAITVTGELDNTGLILDLDNLVGNPFALGSTGTIIGGTVTGSSPLTVGPSVSAATLIDVTMDTDLVIRNATQLSIFGALTLTGGSVSLECSPSFSYLNFVDSSSVTGTGEIVFNGTTGSDTSCRARPVSTIAQASIGPNITVRSGLSGGRLGEPSSPLNLQGQVNSTLPGRELQVTGNPLTIAGAITATGGGEINLDGSWANAAANTISVTDGVMLLQGDWTNDGDITAMNSSLTFGGTLTDTWNNTGALTLTGTPLLLDGTFTLSNLGSYTSNDVFSIIGMLDNNAATLDLDSLNATGLYLGNTGIVEGGTIAGTSPWSVGPSVNATLKAVTLGVDLQVLESTQLTIDSNLTLNDVAIELTSVSSFSYLNVNGNQTIDGTGAIVFAGSTNFDSANRVRRTGTGLTTFAAGISFDTQTTGGWIGDSNRDTTILGNITSDLPGRSLSVLGDLLVLEGDTTVSNGGELIVDGNWQLTSGANITSSASDIQLLGSWQNLGSIVANDSSINFGNTESDSWNNTGTITLVNSPLILDGTFSADDFGNFNTDLALTLSGTIDLTGTSLDLNSLGSSSTIIGNGARIIGGTLTGSTVSVGPAISGITLDGVTLSTNLDILNNSQVNVVNNLILDNANVSIKADTGVANLILNGAQLIGGTGEIIFGGTTTDSSANQISTGSTGSVLTVGSGVTILTDTANGRLGSSGSTIVINGDLVNRRANGFINVLGTNFELAGTISIGATAEVEVSSTNITLLPGATTDIDIDASSNGLLSSVNAITLSGTANFDLANGFTPGSCQSFGFVTYPSFSGGFTNVTGPDLNGHTFSVDEQPLEAFAVAPGPGC